MSEAGQYLDLNGVGGKAEYVKAIIDNNCTVSSYSLDNSKVEKKTETCCEDYWNNCV